MAKKRKDAPAPSNTLLQYFAKDGSSTSRTSSSKKSKTDVNTVKLEYLEGATNRSFKQKRQDVIVIDSDEEPSPEYIDIASSSDVEVCDSVQEDRGTLSRLEKESLPEIPGLSDCPSFPDERFGSATENDDTTFVGGDRSEGDITRMTSTSSAIKDEAAEWMEEFDVEVEEQDDGWEGAFTPDGATGFEGEESGSIEVLDRRSCPICGSSLQSTDKVFMLHVNECLDEPAVGPSFIPGPPKVSTKYSLPLDSTAPSTSKHSAFSIIMSGKAERERAAWTEAQKAEDRSFRPTKNNRRQAPFYKVLTGMPIAVDAFRYGYIPGITAYFLTHAHSDHYTNLSSSWKGMPIYCSETTANLIVHMLSVDKQWVRPLPMNIPVIIPETGGVKVTLIDANHCPGSCLFLFEGLQTINAGDSTYKSKFIGSDRTFRYLHCGDFRACPQHVLHPQVKGRKIDSVYLDTTYLNPKYCFPPQPLVVDACAELARRIVNGESMTEMKPESSVLGAFRSWARPANGKGKQKETAGDTLIVVGTYCIGKERIVKAIAKALGTQVYCDNRKAAILRCQDDPELHALLTNKPLEAGVHLVPLGQVASDRFKEYMDRWKGRWAKAVAFRPTGWTYSPPAGADTMPPVASVVANAQARTFTYANLQPARNSTPTLMQYGVPYSEHSSFAELACFALSIDCAKVIATVNVGSATGRAKMQKWVERWDSERKKRREAGEPAIVKYRSLEYW